MKKKTLTLFVLLLITLSVKAQTPESFNYQAVARDNSGQPITNQEVTVEISILQGHAEGDAVYQETFSVETNAFGLLNLSIGEGNTTMGLFSEIDWEEGPYYVLVSMDETGGTNLQEMGVSKLMSVPYALHALTSADTFSGDFEDLDNVPDFSDYISVESAQPGDLLYFDEDGWNRLPIGEDNQVLLAKDGAPQWTTVSFGDTDLLPPTVVIHNASNITTSSAVIHAEATEDGGANITERGIVWSTEENPGFEDNVIEEGSGLGEFSVTLDNLEMETTYYTRAFATNGVGTSFSSAISFNTLAEGDTTGTVTDIEGNTYNTVLINDLWWMAENLRTRKYNDGTDIPTGFDEDEWVDLTFGAWTYFDDDLQWDSIYGKLYNWYAVDDSRGLCPEGWRLPIDDEIKDLRDMYGGYLEAGGPMKETGTHEDGDGYWREPNAGATNETGFSARPGGARIHGVYFNRETTGYFWTSDDTGDDYARNYLMVYDTSSLLRHIYQKHYGLSVRCVKE